MGCEVSGRQLIIRLCKQESEVKMVSPATAVAATRSASDTNFRRSKESGSACYSCGGNGFPRLILIFVAAKRMVSPATVVAATRSASDSNLRCRREGWFRLQNGLATASILDFRARLENRCKVFLGNPL